MMGQVRRPQDQRGPWKNWKVPQNRASDCGWRVAGLPAQPPAGGWKGAEGWEKGVFYLGIGLGPCSKAGASVPDEAGGPISGAMGVGALVEDGLGTARERPQQASPSLAVLLLPGN